MCRSAWVCKTLVWRDDDDDDDDYDDDEGASLCCIPRNHWLRKPHVITFMVDDDGDDGDGGDGGDGGGGGGGGGYTPLSRTDSAWHPLSFFLFFFFFFFVEIFFSLSPPCQM